MAYVIDSKQVLLVTLIVLGALNAIFYLKNRRVDRRNVINTLFIMYFMIMLSFTLLPILLPPMHTEELHWNLDLRYLAQALSDRSSLINFSGNAVLFAPISILGYKAGYRWFKDLKMVLVTSVSLSVIVELLQGVETYYGFADFPAVVDINDIIKNTVGALLGYMLIKKYDSGKKQPLDFGNKV